MFESGYILQLYIYATALDRFLRANLPGYDFDRHFGGGYYLFVRGIDAGGVFVHRPTAEALKAFRRGLKTPDQPSIFPQRR
jgi:exodeoxyribonuclease V beta subunit